MNNQERDEAIENLRLRIEALETGKKSNAKDPNWTPAPPAALKPALHTGPATWVPKSH